MKRQAAFSLAKSPEQRRRWEALLNKLVDSQQLDYAVLMAHVLIYEDLCHLLGVRLRTNSLPKRMPPFATVTALALAGSQFAQDRKTLNFLNTARNTVAHRTDRSQFEHAARQFAQRSCNGEGEYKIDDFTWPPDEKGRVQNFCYGIFVWQSKTVDFIEEFEKS